MKQRILDYFHGNRESVEREILALLEEVVRERTINLVSDQLAAYPFLAFRGEEYRVARIVTGRLDDWKVPYESHTRREGRPNVIARIGRNVSGKRLLTASHMDIVPPGDGWDSDPFTMTRKGDVVVGRGVLDNKGPLASSMIALRILNELGAAQGFAGQFQVAALSDEEAHDPDGIDYGIGFLMEEGKVDATMAIIPDIGENMKRIDIAEKGTNFIKVTAFGKQAHGSTPERGVNAVYAMARLIAELEKLQLPHEPHPLLGRPSLNLGQIKGGVAPNVVPGECTITLDIRAVPGMTPDGIVAELRACCGRAGGEFRIDPIATSLPHDMNPDHELVRAIRANSREQLGFEPECFGMGGATFAKTLNLRGIPSVGWGPGDDEAFHMVNESVEVRQLVEFCKMLCLVSADLLQ